MFNLAREILSILVEPDVKQKGAYPVYSSKPPRRKAFFSAFLILDENKNDLSSLEAVHLFEKELAQPSKRIGLKELIQIWLISRKSKNEKH